MTNVLLENGLAVLAFARQATLAFLEDFPEDKLCYSPIPHGNHALWLIGHIAITDDTFLHELGGKPRRSPESWNGLFGMGSQPLPSLSDYPSAAELKAHLQGSREDLVGWFRSMPEAKLTESLPDDFQRFGPNYAGLMSTIAWHEGMHAGQLRFVAKSLGKPPKFG